PDPVGFVKFFELSDVGLTVSNRDQKDEPSRDGVRLKDVRKDSPFASGLRAGDVVTALEGTKATSPEIFRRLLRRKLGQGVPLLTFTVRRSGKTLDVPIPMKEE
ncbi:MAG TPA: PDZ domain-containing protein, partial [Gemmataceae bacterium]